jgi:dTDP-4-amino-4,6-dideoxygalactose transaminase
MKIPLFDLKAQYLSLKPEIDAAMAAVIDTTAFIRGPFVEKFEKEFAAAVGAKHCISCADGTGAIYITLKMLGVGPGDEVITTANSWIATSEVITQCGAKPVFVDVEDAYHTIDPALIEAKITPRTKGILPVHLLGQPAAMTEILALAEKHGLWVVEDCAQCHLATHEGRMTGLMGRAGTFSFYPGKNLGAFGDAGAIVTNDDALADLCRCYARHGSDPTNKHDHRMEGINSRLDGLQAAILSAKLPSLAGWSEARREKAKRYDELFAECPLVRIPKIRPSSTHVYHVYSIRVPQRDAVQKRLAEQGIASTIHYPTPLPFLKAYEYLGHTRSDFPVAAQHQAEMLSLPIYPEITDEQQQRVASAVIAALQELV